MDNIKVCFKKLTPSAKLPERMSESAAGYDIFANIERIVMKPMSRVIVPTGFAMSMPIGFEAQIRPRSGLAAKFGVTVLNSPGTIDADYRGEVKVILINLSEEDFVIEKDMRIAQMVVCKHTTVDFEIVETLDETVRGDGGFGHSNY